jgi:hypothetical protein
MKLPHVRGTMLTSTMMYSKFVRPPQNFQKLKPKEKICVDLNHVEGCFQQFVDYVMKLENHIISGIINPITRHVASSMGIIPNNHVFKCNRRRIGIIGHTHTPRQDSLLKVPMVCVKIISLPTNDLCKYVSRNYNKNPQEMKRKYVFCSTSKGELR